MKNPEVGDSVKIISNTSISQYVEIGEKVDVTKVVLKGDVHPDHAPAICTQNIFWLDIKGQEKRGFSRSMFEFPISKATKEAKDK